MNLKFARQIIDSSRGAALIIVLAFVVLLTGLAVAFFSRAAADRQVSSSSASQSNAELLARGALAITIGDLKQEIAAGSTQSTLSGVTVYTPNVASAPYTLTPSLVGSTGTGGLENLVKRSANGLAFYTGANYNTGNYPASNRAAGPSTQSSTTLPSVNGRSVSTARWNKPLLLRKAAIASDIDYTPVNTGANAFTAPDWILVARDGSNPTAWSSNMVSSPSNTTSVIGRYAYAIYDEGGLLDMNAVGNPTTTTGATGSTIAQIGRKGTQAYADLTQIPGIAAVAGITALTTAKQAKFINDVVGWRNYASSSAGGRLGNFSSSNAYTFTSGTNFYYAILGNNTGFMKVNNMTLNGGQSDRMFASRQELINFLIRGIASSGSSSASIAERANLQYALQYFGTFSRELNRPSWKPYTPTGSTIDYATLARTPNPETSSAINRDLTAIRDSTGSQFIKTRFPLSRICWITSKGPSQPLVGHDLDPSITTPATSDPIVTQLVALGIPVATIETGTAANIKASFGLVWDSRTPVTATVGSQWVYTSPSPANSGGSFDPTSNPSGNGATVIKTLTTVKSEARQPDFFEFLKAVILSGSVGLGSGTSTLDTFVKSEPKYYSTTGGLSADCQLIQIGANIIDAWDNDNLPTLLGYGINGGSNGFAQQFAGVENLPYLNKLVFSFFFTNHGHGDNFSSWLVPSLWNPHQNAASAPATQDVRFAMTSGSTSAAVTNPAPTSWNTPAITGSTGAPNSPYIQVHANAFAPPSPPISIPAPGNETATNGPISTTLGNYSYDGLSYGTYSDPGGIDWKNVDSAYPIFSTPGPTFEMQVLINGTWKAYQRWTGCAQSSPLLSCTNVPNKKGGWKNKDGFKDPEFVALDPRTVRFGIWGSDASDTGNDNDYHYGAEDTMDQNLGLELISAMKPQGTSFSSSGSAYYRYAANTVAGDQYADLDGVKRRGDFTTNPPYDGTSTNQTIMFPADSADRPQILSAPFQSVAELGQVFRDQPWKTLNFTSASAGATSLSADAGLLDAFTLQDASMVAGKTSLNTRQTSVLTAILSQAAKKLNASVSADLLTSAQVTAIVTALQNLTLPSGQAMLINKGELVTRLASDNSVTGLGNKEARECVIRAFSDACQTRTWNLMIDVIAQSGRYPPTATNLSQFVVEGEKRYWLHIAIDRFTGEIVDQQLEAVYE